MTRFYWLTCARPDAPTFTVNVEAEQLERRIAHYLGEGWSVTGVSLLEAAPVRGVPARAPANDVPTTIRGAHGASHYEAEGGAAECGAFVPPTRFRTPGGVASCGHCRRRAAQRGPGSQHLMSK